MSTSDTSTGPVPSGDDDLPADDGDPGPHPTGAHLGPLKADVTAEQLASGDLDQDDVRQRDVARALTTPLWQRPTVRAGVYAWSFIGLLIMAVVIGLLIGVLSIVLVPIVLALFPAAVLSPLSTRLKVMGLPPAAAATLVLLGAMGVVTGVVTVIAPQFAAQGDVLAAAVADGYQELDDFLASGPFGLQPIRLDDLIEGIAEELRTGGLGGEGAAGSAFGFAVRIFETAAATLLMLVVLFFYLKDGEKIAFWVRSVFPQALHDDVTIIGELGWRTVGGYIQGQLLVALVDAIFIGLGLWALGVELALPLAVIVFIGGLFPIIGATVSGILAALVALATDGVATALLVVVLVIVVQQAESNILQPVIQSRMLKLHPLGIVLSIAVGGFMLGILGAFLAVPVAAAGAQTVGYLRKRIPG